MFSIDKYATLWYITCIIQSDEGKSFPTKPCREPLGGVRRPVEENVSFPSRKGERSSLSRMPPLTGQEIPALAGNSGGTAIFAPAYVRGFVF